MSEMSKEDLRKLNHERAADTLRGVFCLVDQVEFELQDVLQNCLGIDRIDDVTIKKINELNYKISVLKEAGNNIYERKRRLELRMVILVMERKEMRTAPMRVSLKLDV